MAVQTVTAPTRLPREFGLKSVAEFDEDNRVGANQDVTYQALPCGLPQGTVALCWEDLGTRVAKTGTDAGWDQAIFDPFIQYAGASCFITPDDDFAEQARMTLEFGEEDAIVDKIADWSIASGTDLGEFATANIALAEVEEGLRTGYRGRGTILMSAYTAMVLNPGLVSDGDYKVTPTGSRVGIVPGAPRLAIFGVGAIKVLRSPLREFQAPDLNGNVHLAIAERVYTALVDCNFAAYATIAVTP